MKVAPCKFHGPNPNEVGNLCIIAHNWVDEKTQFHIRAGELSEQHVLQAALGHPVDVVFVAEVSGIAVFGDVREADFLGRLAKGQHQLRLDALGEIEQLAGFLLMEAADHAGRH